jgi:hypothetical protein
VSASRSLEEDQARENHGELQGRPPVFVTKRPCEDGALAPILGTTGGGLAPPVSFQSHNERMTRGEADCHIGLSRCESIISDVKTLAAQGRHQWHPTRVTILERRKKS